MAALVEELTRQRAEIQQLRCLETLSHANDSCRWEKEELRRELALR